MKRMIGINKLFTPVYRPLDQIKNLNKFFETYGVRLEGMNRIIIKPFNSNETDLEYLTKEDVLDLMTKRQGFLDMCCDDIYVVTKRTTIQWSDINHTMIEEDRRAVDMVFAGDVIWEDTLPRSRVYEYLKLVDAFNLNCLLEFI